MIVKSIPVLEESPWGLNYAYTAGLFPLSHCSINSSPYPKGGSPGDGTQEAGWRPPTFQKVVFWLGLLSPSTEIFCRGAVEN